MELFNYCVGWINWYKDCCFVVEFVWIMICFENSNFYLSDGYVIILARINGVMGVVVIFGNIDWFVGFLEWNWDKVVLVLGKE